MLKQALKIPLDNIPVIAHSIDPQTGVIWAVSDYWVKAFGWTREEVIGRVKSADLLVRVDQDRAKKVIEAFARDGFCQDVPYTIRCKDGEEKQILLDARLIQVEQHQFSYACIRDITAQMRLEEELKYLGYHDPLTGLLNRNGFDSKIQGLFT